VIHREVAPGFPIPTVFAIVELDEGYHMFSNVVECDLGSVRIDMPLEVTFEECSPEITLPMFRPLVHAATGSDTPGSVDRS
jgi:uncharacterized OB-fold protein